MAVLPDQYQALFCLFVCFLFSFPVKALSLGRVRLPQQCALHIFSKFSVCVLPFFVCVIVDFY